MVAWRLRVLRLLSARATTAQADFPPTGLSFVTVIGREPPPRPAFGSRFPAPALGLYIYTHKCMNSLRRRHGVKAGQGRKQGGPEITQFKEEKTARISLSKVKSIKISTIRKCFWVHPLLFRFALGIKFRFSLKIATGSQQGTHFGHA